MTTPNTSSGFTLIETFVAITILVIAVVAPMSLVAKSLSVSYYVRDEMTASYLAQEAIETVRNIRDSTVVDNLKNNGTTDPFAFIDSYAKNATPFTVDAHLTDSSTAIAACSGTCQPVDTNGVFYGYPSPGDSTGWTPTRFTRTVTASYVDAPTDADLHLTVTVSWKTGGFYSRSITLNEDLYKWAAL